MLCYWYYVDSGLKLRYRHVSTYKPPNIPQFLLTLKMPTSEFLYEGQFMVSAVATALPAEHMDPIFFEMQTQVS